MKKKSMKPVQQPDKSLRQETQNSKTVDNPQTQQQPSKPFDIPFEVKTRYGRLIRPPIKYTPEDRPLDDTNDEDDSSSDTFSTEELALPSGEHNSESDSDDEESEDEDAGSLKDFIVGDDEIDSSESDDEESGNLSDEYESDQETSDDSDAESQNDDQDSYLQDI